MSSRIRFALSWLASVLVPAVLLAQDGDSKASPDKSGWTLGYALVFLGIALGLSVVLRPAHRSSESRVQEDE